MYGVASLLFVVSCLVARGTSSGSRCLSHHQLGDNEAVAHTPAGHVLGLTQTQLDPRLYKNVTWTSYFVSHVGLASLVTISRPGYPLRGAPRGATEVPSACSSAWLELPA